MPMRALTDEWAVDLDASFDSRVVDGDLQLLSLGPPRRTVWLTVWGPPQDESVADVLAQIREDVHPDPVQRFEEGDDAEGRYASWYPEPTEDGGRQWGLYAYTVRSGSYVQAAFLVDEETDLTWALAAWRSLTFTAGPR